MSIVLTPLNTFASDCVSFKITNDKNIKYTFLCVPFDLFESGIYDHHKISLSNTRYALNSTVSMSLILDKWLNPNIEQMMETIVSSLGCIIDPSKYKYIPLNPLLSDDRFSDITTIYFDPGYNPYEMIKDDDVERMMADFKLYPEMLVINDDFKILTVQDPAFCALGRTIFDGSRVAFGDSTLRDPEHSSYGSLGDSKVNSVYKSIPVILEEEKEEDDKKPIIRMDASMSMFSSSVHYSNQVNTMTTAFCKDFFNTVFAIELMGPITNVEYIEISEIDERSCFERDFYKNGDIMMRITQDELIPAEDGDNPSNIYFIPTQSWIQSRDDIIKFFTSSEYHKSDMVLSVSDATRRASLDMIGVISPRPDALVKGDIVKCEKMATCIHVVPRMECFDTMGLTEHEEYYAMHQFSVSPLKNDE